MSAAILGAGGTQLGFKFPRGSPGLGGSAGHVSNEV